MTTQKTNDPNYILQLNAFHRWLDTHYLSAPAQLLWYDLIDLCNRSGWSRWMQIDTLRLMLMLGVRSQNAAFRARDALVEAGLLDYEKGKKGCPNRYRLLFFPCQIDSENEREPENSTEIGSINASENGSECVHKTEEQANDITKQNRNETKRKPTDVPAPLRETFDAYAQMRKKMRKPLTDPASHLVLQTLGKLAPDRPDVQRQILEQSILNGWAGVYPLKNEETLRPPASYDIEEMERRLLYGKIELRKNPRA